MISDTAEYWYDIKSYFNNIPGNYKRKRAKKHLLVDGKPVCGTTSFKRSTTKLHRITCKNCLDALKEDSK